MSAIIVVDDLIHGPDDIKKVTQISFFDDITEEYIRKTKWLLGMYVEMIDIIKKYELAQKEMENGHVGLRAADS